MFKNNRSLLVISLIALVNMLGYGIVIPLLYAYSKKFGLSDFQNGLLFSTFSVCQFIATPVIGRLSDKFGRRPMLLISIAGTAVSFFLMAFAPGPAFLFLARALDGITAGNIPVAFAVISDTTKPQDRAKTFGIVGAAFNFGFVFGPAIAALTISLGNSVPFIIAGLVSVLAVVLTWLYLPETNIHMGEVKQKKLFDFGQLWHTLFEPNVGPTLLISLLFFMAFSCGIIYGFQPFAISVLKISQSQNAQLFTLFGLIGLITQTYLIQYFTKTLGMKKAFRASILGTAIAFFILFLFHSLHAFVITLLVIGVFNGIAQTLIPTILSQEADAKSQGSIMGLNTSYQSIGLIVGPILGGVIATIAIPYTFLTASLLVGLCFIISFRVLRRGIRKESAF